MSKTTLKKTKKPLKEEILKQSEESTDFSSAEHAQEMVIHHTKQIQVCMELYHKSSAQVQKHQIMLDYYQKQLQNEQSK